MTKQDSRIENEKKIVEKMISYYCQHKHSPSTNELYQDCSDLLTYSHMRLELCQFGEEKPTCRKCPVHCYSPTKRAKIRAVMRYAGSRMLFRAPLNWIKYKLRER
jgi:hypothetical protein